MDDRLVAFFCQLGHSVDHGLVTVLADYGHRAAVLWHEGAGLQTGLGGGEQRGQSTS